MSLRERLGQIERLLESRDPQEGAASLFDRGRWNFWELATSVPQSKNHPPSGEIGSIGFSKIEPSVAMFRRYLDQLRGLDSMAQCPIVAITGMLNAGKSSLLASFLSKQGRERVLIGQANDEGTHRFVLWVPESWRQDRELWNMIVQQLVSVFGSAPENLADRLEEAKRQYNGQSLEGEHRSRTETLAIPLIATDPQLDQWGIAMMDCPDVQTGIWVRQGDDSSWESGNGLNRVHERFSESERSKDRADHRALVLSQAMQLCSAFFVVATANGLHDQLILNLLSAMQIRMPGIRRILIVNRVPRRYRSSEISAEVKGTLGGFDLDRLYMAYHFDGPLLRERLPSPLKGTTTESDDPLPICFRIDHPQPPQPPEPIDPQDYLVSIGGQIDRGRLIGVCRSTIANQLEQSFFATWEDCRREREIRCQRLSRVWQMLAEGCLAFSLDPQSSGTTKPELRLHASREIVAQLSQSLERTAPLWAKPSRMVIRVAQSTKEAVSKVAHSMVPWNWMGSSSRGVVDFVQGKFRRGELGKVVSAGTLVEWLNRNDLRGDLGGADKKDLESRCQSTIDRFQSESRTRLDEQPLDEYTRQIWEQMGWRERLWTGLGPATLAFAPLLAVIALPFDFGGTSVLVLASMKELLFAGVAGVGLTFASRDTMPRVAEQQAAWQQLSDLFAIGCDELGIPRPQGADLPTIVIGNQKHRLMASSVPVGTEHRESILPIPFTMNIGFYEKMKSLFERLKEEASQ